MQIIRNKEKIGNTVFLIGLVLEFIVLVTDHLVIWTIPYRGRIVQLAFALFAAKILSTYYTKCEWAILIGISLLGTVSYLTCHEEYILRVAIFIFATKSVDLGRYIPYIIYGLLIVSLLNFVLSLLGIGGDMSTTMEFRPGVIETRYSLGFNHANNVHDMFCYISLLYLFVKNEQTRYYHYLILTTINVLLVVLTRSRNGFAISELIIIAFVIVHYYQEIGAKKYPYILAWLCEALCVIITYYAGVSYVYASDFYAKMNAILSNRMEMVAEYAGVRFWKVFPGPRSSEFVDNGFAVFAYCYGTLIFVCLCLFILYGIWRCYSLKRIDVLIVLVAATLLLFMESTFVLNTSLLCCPFWLYLPFVVWNEQKV